jgi:subtilisin family serine protease
MTRMETQTFRLTGRRLFRWRIDGGTSVPDMIRSVAGETQVAGAQPNYLFALAQDPLPQMNADQYAPERLHLPEAHKLATGSRVLVAVIDSGIDASHEDLAGAVVNSFDATAAKDSAGNGAPHTHGTGMAGAIAARRNVLGTAPRVGVLAVRAFDPRTHAGEGTTFNIIKGLEWAVASGARIINMSFAGPADPRIGDLLDRAAKRGIVLIAAAGNAGPNSPPLFPASNRNVIAVTATDIDDRLYTGANRGNHIAVAAPGVDVLVPAPGGSYQFTTGTSVAAAHVSGVVALLMERNPKLTPADARRILTRTAKSVGPRDRAGAGLVNAYEAVANASSRAAAAPKQPPASAGQR